MNRFIAIFAFLLISLTSFSQFEMGLRMGLNSFDLASEPIIFQNENKNLELSLAESDYGFHFGIYSRVKLFGIYVEPAIHLNSTQVNYSLTEFVQDEIFESVKSERFTSLDIPLQLGFKLGFLRLSGGPVAHIVIDSSSELFDISGYSQRFKSATYGFWAGAGLDIGKLRFDINYEGNLDKFGDHITIDGNDLAFSESANRLLFTLGYKF